MKRFKSLALGIEITSIAFCVAILAACESSTSTVDDREGLRAYRIAFVSERDGNSEIYLMNGAGEKLRRLTNHPGYDTWPTWSPDGSLLLFTSGRDGGQNLYVTDANGLRTQNDLRTHRITYTQSPNEPGVWSPDGQMIAHTSGLSGVETEIYVVNPSGTSVNRVTKNDYPDFMPTWSPDGTRLAFYSMRTQFLNQIYVMSSSGQNQMRITDSPFGCTRPLWNPKRDEIAFVKSTGKSESDLAISVMNVDGGNQRELFGFSAPFHSVSFAWSPSGDILLASKGETAKSQIYTIEVSNFTVQNLSGNQYDETSPSWSPDGQWIVFVSTRDGNKEIYVMRKDGTNATRLTFDSAVDDYPVFSPRLYK